MISEKSPDNNPGPGMYKTIETKKCGKYPISSFRNTTNIIKWENYKLGRFSIKGEK